MTSGAMLLVASEIPANPSEPTSIITATIRGGLHRIGLDQTQAEFFNQTPRFSAEVPSFQVDLRPATDVSGSFLSGFTYAEALRYCEMPGARLPTEVEWAIDYHDRRFVAPGRRNDQTGFCCVEEIR